MNKDFQQVYDLCKQHMHGYVLVETTDGSTFDGIVTGLDDEYVYFAVPVEPHEYGKEEYMYQQGTQGHESYRYGFPGYGYLGYGFPGYGFGYGRPPRRFNRLVLPLAALAAITALSWY